MSLALLWMTCVPQFEASRPSPKMPRLQVLAHSTVVFHWREPLPFVVLLLLAVLCLNRPESQVSKEALHFVPG